MAGVSLLQKLFGRAAGMAIIGALAHGGPAAANDGSPVFKKYGQEFKGKIARSYADSKEWWPQAVKPKPGTPNVLAIMLDDVGFAHLGSYGGLIDTPNIDRLANNGLRFNNFTTTALCSSSRASFLAGRNHHRMGLGSHSVTAMGFPGYNAMSPDSVKSFAKNLQKAGFVNYALGKWDHMPLYQVTETGPFNHWPSGEGFDHYYGFMAAETDNFRPSLWRDHHPVEDWQGKPDYIYGKAMADEAIRNITSHVSIAPDRPFMMYYATPELHAPHQAPAEFVARYKGRFDMGWDKARETILARQVALGIVPKGTRLAPRQKEVRAWAALSADEKRLFARQMEVAAAALTHSDYQIGRIVDALERTGQLDNTVIIIVSDNGASAEGSLGGTYTGSAKGSPYATLEKNLSYIDQWGRPGTDPHYAVGWAMAGNTPFPYFKQSVHRGGVSDPMIVHWPKGIKDKGSIRSQFHHITDIAPTILEVTGTPFMATLDGVRQVAMDGISMAYTFNNGAAKPKRTEQYYELFGNRGIRKDGWSAVSIHGGRMPWHPFDTALPFENDRWELYNRNEDFSESEDLAARYPKKLEELKKRWDKQAWENNVYPLHDSMSQRWNRLKFQTAGSRREFAYYPPGAVRIAESASAPVRDLSHSIETSLELAGDEQGALLACGGSTGGYAMFIKDGRAWYEYNHKGETRFTLKSQPLPKGKVDLKFNFVRTGINKGRGELYVNGVKVDEIDIDKMHVRTFALTESFDVGLDTATPVTDKYGMEAPFAYTGKLDRVVVRLTDPVPATKSAALER